MIMSKYIRLSVLGFVFALAAIPFGVGAQALSSKQSPDSAANPPTSRLHGGSIAGTVITNVDMISSAPTLVGSNAVSSSTNLSSPPASSSSQFISSDGDKYRVISFAQLASFIFAPAAEGDSISLTEQVPTAVRSLNEKSVALTGFMLPVQTENNLTTDFLLLRNQSACCYGVMPKINEWVIVRTTGKGVKATMDTPITVLGTFHVGAVSENGSLSGIYKLDCDRIINPKE